MVRASEVSKGLRLFQIASAVFFWSVSSSTLNRSLLNRSKFDLTRLASRAQYHTIKQPYLRWCYIWICSTQACARAPRCVHRSWITLACSIYVIQVYIKNYVLMKSVNPASGSAKSKIWNSTLCSPSLRSSQMYEISKNCSIHINTHNRLSHYQSAWWWIELAPSGQRCWERSSSPQEILYSG